MRSEFIFAIGICLLGACATGVSDGELGDDDGDTSLASGTGGTTPAVAAGPDTSTTSSPSTTTMMATGTGTTSATATGTTSVASTTNAATSPASAAVGPAPVSASASTGGGACAHSPCVGGGPLAINCDPCVTYICTLVDPTCCQNIWDEEFCGLFASVYCAQCA